MGKRPQICFSVARILEYIEMEQNIEQHSEN